MLFLFNINVELVAGISKSQNKELRQYPYSGSGALPCGQTEGRTDGIVAFKRQSFLNAIPDLY
jgi:hypothetical protein